MQFSAPLRHYRALGVLLSIILWVPQLHAQDSTRLAFRISQLMDKGALLIDKGLYQKALEQFEEVLKLDSTYKDAHYERALAYYYMEDFAQAIAITQASWALGHVHEDDIILIANSFDYLNQLDSALYYYELGLDSFPQAASFMVEAAIACMGTRLDSLEEAYLLRALVADPTYSRTYASLAGDMQGKQNEVWAVIYAEMYLVLAPSGEHTEAMRQILFDTYKHNVAFAGDGRATISFASGPVNTSRSASAELPFGIPFESALVAGAAGLKSYANQGNSLKQRRTHPGLLDLVAMRVAFTEAWFQAEYHEAFPNVLFQFHQELQQAGHLEAYTYWLFRHGDPVTFSQWQSQNKEAYDDFVDYFNQHSPEYTVDNILVHRPLPGQ